MSLRFAVVHEAEADLRTATELADRVLINSIYWLDEHLIANQRMWVAEEPEGRHLRWKSIPQLARDAGIRAHGHFDGEAGEADAAAARRAILYLLKVVSDLKAILLIRDQDDQPARQIGLEQARTNAHPGMVIVIELAVVERECWVLSGFNPLNDDETTRLEAARQALGFNPCEQSHELTACKNDQALRSPKRVLQQLSGNNEDRQRHCWRTTSLDQFQARGAENGLAAYLQEIHDRLAPLIGHLERGS